MSDERQFSIVPIRALLDERLDMADRVVLLALGAHTNRAGLCYPSQATLMRYAGLRERALRNALRHLEQCGFLRVWKEEGRNQYQVLHDVPALEVALLMKQDRHADAGVIGEKRHRHLDAGPPSPEGDRHGDAGPAPGCRTDRHEDADGTGTAVPGERVLEQRTDLTAADAREEPSMTGPVRSDSTPDSGASLRQQCVDLALAVNRALRDNPATASQAQLYPLRADLAATPLSAWLAAGIPFDLIRDTCAGVAARFKPVQQGHKISRFTYFENAVQEAWGKAQANAAVDRAGPVSTATPKKIRRLTA